MKKVFWINPIIFRAILLLIACKKEPPSGDPGGQYPQWPAVKTLEATKVDSTTAKLNGTVIGYGLSTTVTFEYGTTTSYGNTVKAYQSPVTGDSITNVSADVSGLDTSSTYHFRIKAENSKWINFYGSDKIFHTTLSSVTDADSNIYHTIRIGSQVWMQENLKTTRYSTGDIIGTTTPAKLSICGETTPKYQWPNSNEGNDSNVAIYGRLYTWYAVTDIRRVCPMGWHVPSNDEWQVLDIYLGGIPVAAGKIKESGTSHWLSPNDGATNESGFTALPGGFRSLNCLGRTDDQFLEPGSIAYWWTSTDGFSANEANFWYLNSNSDVWDGFTGRKEQGFSVRCIEDN